MNKISLGKDIPITDIGTKYQIAGLMISGQGRSFVITLPHKEDDISDTIEQIQLTKDDLGGVLRQMDMLEVEVLDTDTNLKSIVRKSQRQIENAVQWAVYKRDNYTCRYCGRDGIPMSIDHIILWEEGGIPIEDNLTTACKKCNRERGNMHYDEWLKSEVYARLSKNLPQEVKNKNMMLALDLPRLEGLKLKNPWRR